MVRVQELRSMVVGFFLSRLQGWSGRRLGWEHERRVHVLRRNKLWGAKQVLRGTQYTLAIHPASRGLRAAALFGEAEFRGDGGMESDVLSHWATDGLAAW